MLTLDDFESLRVGEQVEAGPLFRGLSQEPVYLTVRARKGQQIEFEAAYFDIRLGTWTCERIGNRFRWEFK